MGGDIYSRCPSCGESYFTDNRVMFVTSELKKPTEQRVCMKCHKKNQEKENQ